MNLFFDTETTGLPDKSWNWRTHYKEWPRIVTIAWKRGTTVRNFIVDQEGKKIPPEAMAVHGITNEIANDTRFAKPLSFVLGMFLEDASKCGNIIGHNVHFDTSMVSAETLRLYGPTHELAKVVAEVIHKDKRLCTMQWGKKHFRGKWPKLTDLYALLFPGETFPAHNAMSDVLACEKCYLEMVKRGWI